MNNIIGRVSGQPQRRQTNQMEIEEEGNLLQQQYREALSTVLTNPGEMQEMSFKQYEDLLPAEIQSIGISSRNVIQEIQGMPRSVALQTLNLINEGVIQHPDLIPFLRELYVLVSAGQFLTTRWRVENWPSPTRPQMFFEEQQEPELQIMTNKTDDWDKYLNLGMTNIPQENYEIDPITGDEIQHMTTEKVLEGQRLWYDQVGTRYYGLPEKGKEQQSLNPEAIGPLLARVFLRGHQTSLGPRAVYDRHTDIEGNVGHPKGDFQAQLAIPSFQGIGLGKTTLGDREHMRKKTSNPFILDTGGVAFFRIKQFPQTLEKTAFLTGVVPDNETQSFGIRVQQDILFLSESSEVLRDKYIPLRMFVTICLAARSVADQKPIQMVFQTCRNFMNTSHESAAEQARDYLEAQIALDLQIDYYYEEIDEVNISFVTVFMLYKHIDFDARKKFDTKMETYKAYNQVRSENIWKKLDLSCIFQEWHQFSCLERIILFSLHYKTKRGVYRSDQFFSSDFNELRESAKKGEVFNVFRFVKSFMKDIPVYLYLEGEDRWYLTQKPNKKEQAFVIVLRKSHAFITRNVDLQRELNKPRQQFKLNKGRSKQTQIVKFVFDIETYTRNTEQIPYLVCVINEFQGKHQFWGENCIANFIVFVRNQINKYQKQRIEFWSFNGSKFDNLLIISEMLFQTSDVNILGSNTQIKIIKFKDIMFYDMILIYPGSLENVAQQLECVHSKKKCLEVGGKDREWYEENKDIIIDYCFYDCLILLDIVIKHYEYKKSWGLEFTQCGTNSALSVKIFQTHFLSKDTNLLGAPTIECYHRERQSYHGGFTQNAGRGEINQPLYYYDINSSYPNVMQGEMPTKFVGEKKFQSGETIIETNLYEISGRWKPDVLLPIYCHPKTGDREIDSTLLYFTEFAKQYRWGIEIKYPYENNLFEDLTIYTVFEYTRQTPFKAFVQTLYEKRLEYRAQNKADLSQSIKLSLNSLYGKMGQRQFPEIVWCRKPELNQYIDREDLCCFDEVDEEKEIYRLQFEQTETLDFLGSLVRYAAYITAAARMNLFKMFDLLGFENILYTDTDSLISKVQMPPQFIDNVTLGKWKLEHELKGAVIWGPKFYKILTVDDKEHQHIKGVRKENYTPEFWKGIKENSRVEIINNNVFTKKFGHVWVDAQKKLIRLKTPNRKMEDYLSTQGWNSSGPFENLEDFKYVHEFYCWDEK